MKQYLDVMQQILDEGQQTLDRTGTGTLSIFGPRMEFDLRRGFPILTTKKIHLKSVIWELLWFLQGRTDVQWLQERGVTIWDEWAKPNGDLGHIYGYQWRKWPKFTPMKAHDQDAEDWEFARGHIDQIEILLDGLINNPYGRRHIVSAWNVSDLGNMQLPPCHMFFQCYVQSGQFLNLSMYQRSADWFLGVPFNIASYAILAHLIARHAGLKPGNLIMNFGDAHLYLNHIEQAKLQLSREPKELPNMMISHHDLWLDYDLADFTLEGYEAHPHIKAPISV